MRVQLNAAGPFQHNVPVSQRIMTGEGDQSALFNSDSTRLTIANTDAHTIFLNGNAQGDVFLNYTPIPEPGTILGLGTGILGVAAFIRLRRKRTVRLAANAS